MQFLLILTLYKLLRIISYHYEVITRGYSAVQLLHKADTVRTKIYLEFKQEISDLQTKVSELIQRDKFVTELINDNHTQNNSKQCEFLEISIQNLKTKVNFIDNKSRANNVLINNVVEKPTENAIQLITKVNKRQPQHSSRQLTPRPQSPSALLVTWPVLSPVSMNKCPSKQYYRQLTPRATCPSEFSADTNFPSKRSHHSALQPLPSSPPPSPATSSQVVDTPCSFASVSL